MDNFEDKTEYNISDIRSLIDNEVEESIHLDFKEANALDKSDGKKKEISKDVSAFANSDGGIIIYGIKETNHKASEITFIDGDKFTKEWLEQTINSSIQIRISELTIYPVRNNGNIHESVYIVKIPKSYDTPHICKDKRFYKRFNFESVMMEEYEIRQLYGQKKKSKLAIWGWDIGPIAPTRAGRSEFIFEVSVYNEGDVVESDFKVNVYFTNYNTNLIEISMNQSPINFSHTWVGDNKLKISADGNTSIYPNEKVTAMRFNLSIPTNKIKEALSQVWVEIILFYSNAQDMVDGDFTELIEKNSI